jgi:hypothetical protein
VRVVARGRDRLQVGLHDSRRLVVRRSTAADRMLADLAAGDVVPPETPDRPAATAALLDRLRAAGLVVSTDELAQAKAVRRATTVLVTVAGPGRAPVVDELDGLLQRAGMGRSATRRRAEVALVVAVGEVRRELLDPLVRADLDHLVVRLVDGGAVLGPFVQPGRTPCLRCVDAHRSLADPDHVAVTARYVQATARADAAGDTDLPDPVLTTEALAAAVRDLVAHAEGREPATRCHTIRVGPAPTDRSVTRWSMHPGCGCSLRGDLGLSGTMGA